MKQLPFSKQQIQDIIKQHGTPFHIYDKKGIEKCVKDLYKAFSWNKGFKEYFAVKALPNPAILKLLKDLGCGVDCASDVELMLCEKIGFNGDDIMFSSNNTKSEEFALANKLGAIINFDDISHIDTLKQKSPIPETVCIRYNPGDNVFQTKGIMGSQNESKFGVTKKQLFEGLSRLKDEGAKRFGIHAFLMSNCLANEYYPDLAECLFSLAVEIKNETGIEISFIDMSGGIGIPYFEEDSPVDIFSVANGVKKAYDEIIIPNGLDISIYTELGRYITGPYGYFVATVLHKKETYKNYVGIDASAVNLMRPAMYGAHHHVVVMGKQNDEKTYRCDVVGSLCENNDKFAINRELPNVDIGDTLVICDTGAHGHSMGSNYNGKLRSAELLLQEDKTATLIRRAETFEDYIACFDL